MGKKIEELRGCLDMFFSFSFFDIINFKNHFFINKENINHHFDCLSFFEKKVLCFILVKILSCSFG